VGEDSYLCLPNNNAKGAYSNLKMAILNKVLGGSSEWTFTCENPY
jgi:hypothetical protein